MTLEHKSQIQKPKVKSETNESCKSENLEIKTTEEIALETLRSSIKDNHDSKDWLPIGLSKFKQNLKKKWVSTKSLQKILLQEIDRQEKLLEKVPKRLRGKGDHLISIERLLEASQ